MIAGLDYFGDARHACKCNPMLIERYMGRISGPLLDRIDLHIEVPAVPFQELSARTDGMSSAAYRERVGDIQSRPLVRGLKIQHEGAAKSRIESARWRTQVGAAIFSEFTDRRK